MSTSNTHFDKSYLRSLLLREGCTLTLLGIGGVSLSAIAQSLALRSVRVKGYDSTPSPITSFLMEQGIFVTFDPLDPTLLKTDAVVYSLAISEDHPTVRGAKARGIPLISRADLLGAILLDFPHRVSVGGTHGKSTTTAILYHLLSCAAHSPTVFCGAPIGGSCFHKGQGDTVIAEACEYGRSLLCFDSTLAVLTSLELDHTDTYSSISDLRSTFRTFLSRARWALVCTEVQDFEELVDPAVPLTTYGFSPDADFSCQITRFFDTGVAFSIKNNGFTHQAYLPMLGSHNASNATAAVAAAALLGVPLKDSIPHLRSFPGLHRRLTRLNNPHLPTYYDYGHHPTEITEAISALAHLPKPLTVIFRPHTFTRTRDLMDGFASALRLADRSFILPIYPAREAPIQGVTSEALAHRVGMTSAAIDFPEAARLLPTLKDGSLLLIGAGDMSPLLPLVDR